MGRWCKKEKTTFNPRGGSKKEWLAWYNQKEEERKSQIVQEEKKRMIQMPGLVVKQEEENKVAQKPELAEKEEKTIDVTMSEARQLSEIRGELTPAAVLKPGQEKKSKRRSPKSQTKRSERLLSFQERLSVKFGLPPSRLMDERRQCDKTPPSTSGLKPAQSGGQVEDTTPSSTTNSRLMPAQRKGNDLREEFERLGAEARLPSTTTPSSVQGKGEVRNRRRSRGEEGRRRVAGSLWSKSSPGPGA